MATATAVADPLASNVVITMADFTGVTAVNVDRLRDDGSRTPVKSGTGYVLAGGPIEDFEAPLDIPVTYVVTQATPVGSQTATTNEVTLASNGFSWLKDPAFPTNNVRLDEVEGLASMVRPSRSGIFDIVDRERPVVITSVRQSLRGDFTFHTRTRTQRINVVDLVSRGNILLIASPPDWGIGMEYVHVGDVTEDRPSPVATEQTRRWTLPIISVDRPTSLSTMPANMRWVDVKFTWQTWQHLYDTGMTWAQLKAMVPGT